MAQSFQKEKPPARINLFLEVLKGDAKKKVELPLRMMMVGDYTGRKEEAPLEDRELVNINKDNFDSVLKAMSLRSEFTVADRLKDDDSEMKVNLRFDDMKSFHPEQVARQVPEINKMLAMRNLLQDLRNRVVNVGQFRKQLEAIVRDPAALERLAGELDRFVARQETEDGAA
jgi:type VI secretion system protein ImpB